MTKQDERIIDGAAGRLLDREPPADYLREWTERIAAESEVAEPGTHSVVIFRIGLEWLALTTAVFQEVAEPSRIHTVPHRHKGILRGLVNIRGELLICVSLGEVLGLENLTDNRAGRTSPTCERLLVASREGNRLVFPVNEVYGVHRYHPREMIAIPATLDRASGIYTRGLLPWQNKTAACLDDALLFYKVNRSLA